MGADAPPNQLLFPDFDTDAVFLFSGSRKGRLYLPANRDLHLAADACPEIGWGEYTGISPYHRPQKNEKNKEKERRWKRELERRVGKVFQHLLLIAIP